jgi:hypothetical protein
MVEVAMLYARIKAEDGVYRLVPVNPTIRALPEPLDANSFLTAQREGEAPKRPTYTCTTCQRRFGSAGVAMLHFNRTHRDLAQDDRETWKAYIKRDDG